MCLDLSASYAKAARLALPDAVLVADRFHLVRLANDMLTQVRQDATREHRGRRGRVRDPEWVNRRRLDSSRFGGRWEGCLDSREVSGYGLSLIHI